MKMHLPKTIDEARDRLGNIDGLVTARQWERAAIVWAFTYDAGRGRPQNNVEKSTLSEAEFAALKVHGLRTRDSVRAYRSAWRWAMEEAGAPDIKPGDEFEAPALDWGFAADDTNRHVRYTRKDAESFSGALSRGDVDAEALAEALDEETAAAITRRVLANPVRAAHVMSDQGTRIAAIQAVDDARDAAIGPPVRSHTPQPGLRVGAVINDLRGAMVRVQRAATAVRDDRLDTLDDDQKQLVSNEVQRLRTGLVLLETLLAEGPITDEALNSFLRGDLA
jgi:hypothetical protein